MKERNIAVVAKESCSCADIFRKEMSLNIGKEHSNKKWTRCTGVKTASRAVLL